MGDATLTCPAVRPGASVWTCEASGARQRLVVHTLLSRSAPGLPSNSKARVLCNLREPTLCPLTS